MKRRASTSSDQLMARMRRQADATVARKRACLGRASRQQRAAVLAIAADGEPPPRPIRLVLADLVGRSDAGVVYRSPQAMAREYERDAGGALLQQYLALHPLEPLWRHQREAVDFMLRREADADDQQCCGGMLCDEMGLGKTKDALCLTLEQNQAEARHTRKRFSGAPTLVVARRILLKNWQRELQQQFPPQAFQYVLLSTESDAGGVAALLPCCDLVLTTYSTVAAAHRRDGTGDALHTLLFGTRWRRVLADEAHIFVQLSTKYAASMLALRAQSAWVLSGTPLQNRRRDLLAFLLFIGVTAPGDARLKPLRRTLMLRRTRASLLGAEQSVVLRGVPNFRRVERRVQLVEFRSTAERLLYCLVAKYATECAGHSARVTQLTQLLRQLCLCPAMVHGLVRPRAMLTLGTGAVERRRGARAGVGSVALQEALDIWCTGRCALRVTYRESAGDPEPVQFVWEPAPPLASTKARRFYERMRQEMRECASQGQPWTLGPRTLKHAARHPLALSQHLVQHLRRHALRLDQPSSKEAAALDYVARVAREAPDDKIIVYSNYVDALRSLERWLRAAGHRTVLVTGQTGSQERNDSLLLEFETAQPPIRVLLMTRTLGAEGLNLHCANRVLFLDLWWNPFATEQAGDRVNRPGQLKDIELVYLVMPHTIEAHMLRVAQAKKQTLTQLLDEEDEGMDVDVETEHHDDEKMDVDEQEASQLFSYSVDIEAVMLAPQW